MFFFKVFISCRSTRVRDISIIPEGDSKWRINDIDLHYVSVVILYMYIYFNNSFELFIWYVWSFDTFEVLETRSFCTKKKYTKYATKFAFLIMTDKLHAYHILPALKWKKILYVFYIVKCDVNCVFIVKNWLESQNKFAPIARFRFLSFLCEFHLL